MSLSNMREKLDIIDTKLIDLFKERMDIAAEIAEEKKSLGSPVLNVQREREILSKVSEQAGETLEGYARVLYNTIFDISRSYQVGIIHTDSAIKREIETAINNTPPIFPQKAVVACQGIEGSYSQLATEKLFSAPSIMYFQDYKSVFNAVEKGLCRYGVLPIENSSHGSVGDVYDLMRHYNCYISKCYKLRISHKLLARNGVKLENVREIISHEQAIGQCSEFLNSLKDVKITVCENTAVAAKLVSESGRDDIAAISSGDCARLYGLSVIHDHIQISDNNYTRFICISKNLEIYPGANKISLILSLPHRPMALYNMLARFASLGLNLTKLESRPIPGSDFEVMFYFDMEASVMNPGVVSLLSELSIQPEMFIFLGNYIEQ